MNDYLLILGRDPDLSLLELVSYFSARNISFKIKDKSQAAVLIALPELDFQKTITDLGGIVKIARVIQDLDNEVLYAGKSNKIKYAVSVYSDTDTSDLKEYLKGRLREEKLKITYKRSSRTEQFLMPNDVVRHRLLDEGFELVVYGGIIARTIAVFNPYEYEKRDKERPLQRTLHMISIRLAKILINMVGAKEGDTILDPFSGYGVLLQEAMLMGINVIGVDNSRECADATKKNLEWTAKQFGTRVSFKAIHADSKQVSRFVRQADFAVTEPYMGPLLPKIPMKDEALKIVAQLNPLYRGVLRELSRVVKGNIAFIVPRFRLYSGERVKIPFERMLQEAGFRVVSIMPEIKMPLIYSATDSKIEREIWVFRKA
ncbi:MAG TPA: hypothetical protein HA362_02905 [Nanoarchaeota archaeon]|nr:hypothetical protein [Nanoarchaeota archaeon]